MDYVLVRVPMLQMKHHDQKGSCGKKVYWAYTYTLLFIIKRIKNRNLEAGADA